MRTLPLVLASIALAACGANPPAPVDAPTQDVGSLRNARVAAERGRDPAPLTYFVRDMSDEDQAEVADLAPNLTLVVGLERNAALARATEADGIDSAYATPEFLRAATKLVWIQAQSAGVDRYVAMPEVRDNPRIVLTNFRGVHGPAIADHVFAMLLTLTRDLPTHLAGRAQGQWQRDGSGELDPIALDGRTLLVVGLGGIGTEIAKRGHGFGMRVIATRRGDDPAPDYVARVAKPDQLLAMLAEADVVALSVPLTPETENMIDARALAAMKTGSYLVNISRGKVVDQDALIESLRAKHLAGACLDVTTPEPLPADNPLWQFPNVVITPHVASTAVLTEERGWALFRENLRRFDAGEPLYNVVDKVAGY